MLQSGIMKERINKSLMKTAITKKKGPSEAIRKQRKAKEVQQEAQWEVGKETAGKK